MLNNAEKLDFQKSKKIKKYLENDKFILLKNIGKSFDLTKKENDYVLSKIMQAFWRGEYNLFSLPWLSDLIKIPRHLSFKINGKQTLDCNVINRGILKSLLCTEIKGKDKIKRKPNLISNRFEFIDDDNSFYETFVTEDWEFYKRIINRINRNFKKKLKQSCPSLDNNKQTNNAEGIDLIHLNTLSLEINDLKWIMYNLLYLPNKDTKKIEDSKQAIESLSNLYNVKNGHYITNEMIFNEYFANHKANPNKSDTKISQELYEKYFSSSGSNTKISSPERIRKIINEQKKNELIKHFERYENDPKTENFFLLLKDRFFTTNNHVEKLYKQYQSNLKKKRKIFW